MIFASHRIPSLGRDFFLIGYERMAYDSNRGLILKGDEILLFHVMGTELGKCYKTSNTQEVKKKIDSGEWKVTEAWGESKNVLNMGDYPIGEFVGQFYFDLDPVPQDFENFDYIESSLERNGIPLDTLSGTFHGQEIVVMLSYQGNFVEVLSDQGIPCIMAGSDQYSYFPDVLDVEEFQSKLDLVFKQVKDAPDYFT